MNTYNTVGIHRYEVLEQPLENLDRVKMPQIAASDHGLHCFQLPQQILGTQQFVKILGLVWEGVKVSPYLG